MSDPLDTLNADRAAARQLADPLADLCSFATIDAQGCPQVRTLVLRDLDQGLGVFLNNTSPKWFELQRQTKAQVLLYLPTLKIQYRIDSAPEPIPKQLVDESWLLRPMVPKVMDWLYLDHYPQSTALESADQISRAFEQTIARLTDSPSASPSAQGVYLKPYRIERLQLLDDKLHQRVRFTLAEGQWQMCHLVP